MDGGNIKFPLKFDQLKLQLKVARKELAVDRCRDALLDLAKSNGNGSDGDYNP